MPAPIHTKEQIKIPLFCHYFFASQNQCVGVFFSFPFRGKNLYEGRGCKFQIMRDYYTSHKRFNINYASALNSCPLLYMPCQYLQLELQRCHFRDILTLQLFHINLQQAVLYTQSIFYVPLRKMESQGCFMLYLLENESQLFQNTHSYQWQKCQLGFKQQFPSPATLGVFTHSSGKI